MPESNLARLFSLRSGLSLRRMTGPAQEGIRATFHLSGAELEGGQIRGRVLPSGRAWSAIQKDGVGIVEISAAFQTEDGALINASYSEALDTGPDGYERLLRHEVPFRILLQSAPRFETDHPGYSWLKDLDCRTVGEIDLRQGLLACDVYHAPRQ